MGLAAVERHDIAAAEEASELHLPGARRAASVIQADTLTPSAAAGPDHAVVHIGIDRDGELGRRTPAGHGTTVVGGFQP